MQNRRGYSKQFPQMLPTSKSEAPASDPPYEVIEFSQQYTNTALPRKVTKSNECKQNIRKCDLCGSSNAQFHCELCAQQTFCVSCDQMYHRHPKRQTHIRKKILQFAKDNVFEPPLPPKNELNQAPIPPPRRNKRTGRISTPSPTLPGTFKKNGSLMGSLKRFMGGMQSPSPQPRSVRNDSRQQKFPHMSQQIDFDQQSTGRDSGYLDWETDSRHRSSSFSNTFNRPLFPGLTQAQSMAQLNCPSCHVRNIPPWDWNRSHMNLHAFQPAWTGLASGNPWHGSMMFPSAYRVLPREQFTRSSFQGHRAPHRTRKFEIENNSESELSISDERKSRKQSPPMTRNVSPALSRRSRKTVISDSDDEIVSRKSDKKYKRRAIPMSREPSPALSRRSYRRKYEEEDAMSMKSAGSRRNLKPVAHKQFLRKNVTPSSSDSDDELTSEREGNDNMPGNISTRPDPYQAWQKRAVQKLQPVEKGNVQKEKIGDQNGDWPCQHCTYINEEKLRVCKMCCKSKACLKLEESNKAEESRLENSMKNLKLSTTNEGEKKKGDEKGKEIIIKKTTSTGTSPPPQTISTQTYEVPNYASKRSRSFTCDDYSDWNPVKRSNSTISCSSDKQSSSITQDYTLSSDFIQALIQNDTKQGIEIVKLLKEAEQYHFEIDDVAAALAQCGDMNPIKWLRENWNKITDTVVTLATNYGREQSENIIGTISSVEAQNALRLHRGDIWAAATECIRQRQKKYAKLMSKGNFSREDVVTVLTANHGETEAAHMELNKTQLKPFLMKIWGPPQGLDNDSGNLSKSYKPQESHLKKIEQFHNNRNNFGRVHMWLEEAINDRTEMDFDYDNIENQLKQSYYNDRLYNEYPSNYGKFKPYLSHYNSFDNLTGTRLNRFKNKWFYNSVGTINLHRQNLLDNVAGEFPPADFFSNSVTNDGEQIQNYSINKTKTENGIDGRNENKSFYNELKIVAHSVDHYSESKNVKLEETESEYYDSAHDFDNELEKEQERVDREKWKIDFGTIKSIKNAVNVSKETSSMISDTKGLNLESENLIRKNEKYLSSLQISVNNNSTFALTDDLPKGHDIPSAQNGIYQLQVSSKLDASINNEEDVDSVLPDLTERYVQTMQVEKLNSIPQQIMSNFNHQFYNAEATVFPNSKKENLITIKHSLLESESTNTTEENILFSELKVLYLLAKCGLDFYIIEMKDSPTQTTNYIKTFVNDQSQSFTLIKQTVVTEIPNTNEKSTEITKNKAKIVTTNNKTFDKTNKNQNEYTITNVYQAELNNNESKKREDLLYKIQYDKNEVNNYKELYKKNTNLQYESQDESSYAEILNSATNDACMTDDAVESEEEDSINENLEKNNFYETQFNQNRKIVNEIVYDVKPMFAIPLNITNRLLKSNKIFYEPISEMKNSHHEDEQKQLSFKTEEETELHPYDGVISNIRNNEIYQKHTKSNCENESNENINDTRSEENTPEKSIEIPDVILLTEELQDSAAAGITAEETLNLPQQIIAVNDKEEYDTSFQARARRFLSEGLVNTYHQAELAVQLMEMKFDRSQSIDAAVECTSIQTAITYLQQECQLCAEKLSMRQMISMLKCEHRCCQECARQFFTLQINENSVDNCVCPFCGEPEISRLDSDAALNYFSNLDIMLKAILNPHTHELFQQKLRDRTLMQDPNFKWCPKCSFGFIADFDQRRVTCPSCRSVSCTQCGNLWEKEHNEKNCEEYKEWLGTQNDSSFQLSNYLEDYGVTCPKCTTKFILVKGGCMHLTCTNCKFEFCSGCLKTFSMGADCKISDYCIKLGLHAHHPRNCLFYLRDKEPQELKQLLLENNIKLNLRKTINQRCDVQLQKETDDGLADIKCGAKVEEGGLCRCHLKEYFSRLICRHKLDTIHLLTADDLETILIREGKKRPPRGYHTPENEYYRALHQNSLYRIFIQFNTKEENRPRGYI